ASAAAPAPRQAGPMRPPGSAPPPPPVQDQSQEIPRSQSTIKTQATIVNIFATVRDGHHAVVNDLKKEDFKITEDGVDQPVSYFARESDLPITLGILMDTSYSMYKILGAEQDAASRFVHEIMRKKDEALVMSFDTDVDLLADFTEDPRVLDQAIRRTQINVDASGIGGTAGTIPSQGGGTNLYDAIYLACHDQFPAETGRKAIVILSDAEDTGSRISLKDAIEAAQRSDAVIHVLLIRDFGATSGVGPGVARQMADDTGGRVIDIRGEKSLDKAFDEITEELRFQYVLGYYSSNDKHDGTFRKIHVDVNRPDMKVLARRGYYAPRH
ncbi:MAG: VWA domain-containing protein, partial [Candidatus Acidiferrales bacterium]